MQVGGGRPDREPAGERSAPYPRRVPVERGQILAADRKTVLAETLPNDDPNSPYLFVRRYPQGELFGQLSGYYSQIYGLTGSSRP